MNEFHTDIGSIRIGGPDSFFTFASKSGQNRWQSRLPARLVLWNGPCQRRQVMEDFKYSLAPMGCRGAIQRYGLHIPDAFLRIEMELEPTGEGFALRFFPATLIEERAHELKLLELDVLPDFFQARQGEAGWFFLPKYSGALFRFSEQREAEERGMVYSEQPKWEDYNIMPVCGIRKSRDAWMCILTQGQFDARIVVRSFRQKDGFQYRLAASLVVRHEKEDPPIDDLREIRFVYFGDARADYNRMALRYRRHLLQDRGLQPLRERAKDNPALTYASRSYHIKIFHGMKLGRLYDGDEPMTVTATFAETEKIARAMQADGVEKCVFFLTGWNAEGHDGMYPSRFPIEPLLGGEAGFLKLGRTLRRLGYQLSVHDNHVDAYRRSPLFPSLDLLTDRAGAPVGGSQWGGGAVTRLCPASMPTSKSLLDMERMQKLGVDGIYYLDNMPHPLFTCHHPRHPVGRRQYAAGLRRLAQSARYRFGGVTCEGPNDYLLETLDMAWIVHAPFPQFVRFDQSNSFIHELVPFQQVACHGILLYHAGYCYGLAAMGYTPAAASALEVALGALPLNEVGYRDGWYIPSYRKWTAPMGQHYRTVCKQHGDLQMMFMQGISIDRDAMVIQADYEDGCKVTAQLKTGKLTVEKK